MRIARFAPHVLAAIALGAALSGSAQAPGIKRTMLQKLDIPAGEREAVQAIAEISAGVAAGRHTHPGPEFGYVLEGATMLMIDGEAPKELKAGDSYLIPAGKIHDAKAVGNKPAKVLATYLVEKGKPLATPAP
jgi:quercetin dioxygenase-like cupin family protein